MKVTLGGQGVGCCSQTSFLHPAGLLLLTARGHGVKRTLGVKGDCKGLIIPTGSDSHVVLSLLDQEIQGYLGCI